jgi:hypothetical protein
VSSRKEQSDYRVSFTKRGPFWFWRGWQEDDDEWSSPWGRGVALSKQRAIWAARRRMIGCIVQAHRRASGYLALDGDELVRLADLEHLPEDPS